MQRLHRVVSTVLLSSVLSFGLLTSGCDKGPQPQAQRQAPVPRVSFATIQPHSVTLTTCLPGRTAPFRIAEIRPQVNGLIQKRLFTEGADVEAGQVLYQIDPASFQAVLDSATAALKRSEANLPASRATEKRYGRALTEKAVSSQDYDNALAALRQVEADIQYNRATVTAARINLAYSRVTAPISGRIGRSSVTEGAIVTAYQPQELATIQQLDPIYVDVPQSTRELLQLKKRLQEGRLDQSGDNSSNVELILEDGSLYPHKGTLEFSDVTVDPTTGSVTLRAIFPNPEGLLLPNMFVRAQISEGNLEQAMLIPQQAVSRNQKGEPYTLIVNDRNIVEIKPLALDRATGVNWLVSSGLEAGDRVIMEGRQMLRPGTRVEAAPFQETADGPPPEDGPETAAKAPAKEGA